MINRHGRAAAYDDGARATKKWSPNHDNILGYAKDPASCVSRRRHRPHSVHAPDLVGPEKAERGKTPTGTWWHTIVSTTGKEKTGYPTQKPLGIVNRIVLVHSNPGDLLLDFSRAAECSATRPFATGRRAVLVDDNVEAMEVVARRHAFAKPIFHRWPARCATGHARAARTA